MTRDITERQQREQALQASEQRFRTLVANIPGAVYRCACDADWTMEYISEAIADICGYPAEEFIGNAVRTFASVIHAGDRAIVADSVSESVARQQPYLVEYRIVHADGSLRWVQEKGQGNFSAAGELLWLDGVILDISERQTALCELTERERHLRQQQTALIDLGASPDFYSGNLSEALARLTQVSADTLAIERVSVWFYNPSRTAIILQDLYQRRTQQHATGLELRQEDYPAYFQALDREEIIAASNAQIDPRTREFTDHYLILEDIHAMLDVPIRSGGKTVGVICHEQVGSPRHWTLEEQNFASYLAPMAALAIEARDRRRTETALQYRAQIDNLLSTLSRQFLDRDFNRAVAFALQAIGEFTLSDRSYTIESSGHHWKMSHEWCKEGITPLYSQSQAIPVTTFPWIFRQLELGQSICVNSLDDLPADATAERESFQSSASPHLIVVPAIAGGQTVGYLGLDASPAKQWMSEDVILLKRVGELIAIAQARHEAQIALQQAKDAADEASRAKSEFLSSMSHELRTPLNAVLGFTQVMQRDRGLREEQQQNLAIISRSGEHLLDLINDILEMSKIEAGQTTFNRSSFDLYRLLDSLETMLRLKAEAKGLQLIYERTANVPQYIQTDEGKLRQVLINLLGNAIKFTSEGGVILRVSSAKSNIEMILLFEVEDTGPGIAPHEMSKLFEVFGQTESGRRSQQGTGLGLPISQKFVQLMGGEITVNSEVGQGSVFRFTIRVAPANELDVQPMPTPRKVIGLAPGQPPYRILAVDDRIESRLLLVKLLSSIGFEVKEACNGQEAIALWESWHPHLIWMDMRMPVMDGYEATQRIKATTKGQATVVIALTASAFEEERHLVLSAGCDDFMRKPFRQEVLWDKIAQYLGVRYLYEDEPRQPLDSQENLDLPAFTPAHLTIMPTQWIEQLQQAAVECSDDHILELLEQLPPEQAVLKVALTELACRFQFTEIFTLTQDIREIR